MKDNFLLPKEIKLFLESLDEMIVNLPRKEQLIKNRFYQDSYDLLELVYLANQVNGKERIKYQKNMLSKISMIDYYLERCFKNKYISEKQALSKSRHLLKINKMICGWIHGSNIT